MQESQIGFHNVEWPPDGSRVAGPVVWLRGWVVGKPGTTFVDIRAQSRERIHLGVLGLPRADLAAHFAPTRVWLPAEFIIAVPTSNGDLHLEIEAQDAHGTWSRLQGIRLVVADDGLVRSRIDGEHSSHGEISTTIRVPHLPFHGHLDDPVSSPVVRHGEVPVFGWLVHEFHLIRAVFATLDGRIFTPIEHGLRDESLARKVPQFPAAREGRIRGTVPALAIVSRPACLRVYAELDDGSVHLCFSYRIAPLEEAAVSEPAKVFPPGKVIPTPLPSGRPRRFLAILRTLHPDEGTKRALDIVSSLGTESRWLARAISTEDGPLRAAFEAAGCPVQLVDSRAFFTAGAEETERELLHLERQIWWRHLDAVVIFDAVNRWAATLATRHGLPVYDDGALDLDWPAPGQELEYCQAGPVLAPVRAQAAPGANVLLHAAVLLAQDHGSEWANRPIVISDIRASSSEDLFRQSAKQAPLLTLDATGATKPAVMICPAYEGHSHRALLTAVAAGVPVISTQSRRLRLLFPANEIIWIPVGNPEALVRALLACTSNPADARDRAEAASRKVRTRFAPPSILAAWIAGLDSLIAAHRLSPRACAPVGRPPQSPPAL